MKEGYLAMADNPNILKPLHSLQKTLPERKQNDGK